MVHTHQYQEIIRPSLFIVFRPPLDKKHSLAPADFILNKYLTESSLGNVKTDETLTDRGIFVSQPWWCLYNCSPILVFMVIFLDLSNKHFFWRRFSSFEFTLSFSLTLFSYVTIYKFWGILKLLKNISHCFYTTFKSCN